MIRKAIRKLLKQLGYALPGKRHGLADAARQLLATYLLPGFAGLARGAGLGLVEL